MKRNKIFNVSKEFNEFYTPRKETYYFSEVKGIPRNYKNWVGTIYYQYLKKKKLSCLDIKTHLFKYPKDCIGNLKRIHYRKDKLHYPFGYICLICGKIIIQKGIIGNIQYKKCYELKNFTFKIKESKDCWKTLKNCNIQVKIKGKRKRIFVGYYCPKHKTFILKNNVGNIEFQNLSYGNKALWQIETIKNYKHNINKEECEDLLNSLKKQ